MKLNNVKREYYFIIWRGRVAALVGGLMVLCSMNFFSDTTYFNPVTFLVGFLLALVGVLDAFTLFNKNRFNRLHSIIKKSRDEDSESKQPWGNSKDTE